MDPLQKQMLDDVFEAFQMVSGGGCVSVVHRDGGFTRYDPAAVDLFGLPGEYVPNGAIDWTEWLHPEDRKQYEDTLRLLADGKIRSYDVTCRLRVKSGEYNNFRSLGAVLRDGEGNPSLIGGVLINQGAMENTDPVTLLPNRHVLNEILTDRMEEGRQCLVLQVSFRKLSKINREHGYSFGNRILQEVAWLIQETVGSRGKVFRLEDAAFAVLSEIPRQDLAAVYDSIRLKMQRGVRTGGVRVNLSACGGMIAVGETRVSPAAVRSCLLSACQESKRYRYGELVDFNGSAHFGPHDSMEMVNTIRECIVENCQGFSIYYQPVVDVVQEKTVAMEALVRWEGEPYGLVEPMDFIPILERDFVFEELGIWILRRVAEDGKRFLERNPTLQVSANISPAQLEDEYFLDMLEEILSDTGFPAENLCLEVSKGCRLLDIDRLREITNALHKMGVRVIIDDFGTGFESVAFLKRLSADYIKFDRDLVRDIESSEADRETVESLSRCAEARGTKVIAKGVETAEMRDILREYRINRIQGNVYAMPLDFEEALKHC